MPRFYQIPFGVSGDRLAIPDPVQSDGSVSYTSGYGDDYEANKITNPNALPLERTKFNELIFDITQNIQQYQQHGVPEFITSADNGGTAYSYSLGAIVRYNNGTDTVNYISLVNSNTALPTVTSNWSVFQAGLYVVQNTDGTITISTAGTTATVSLNLANANVWTGQQTFNASAPIVSTGTASTALVLDASKEIVSSVTTSVELGYVHGVTSAIQTQLNTKQNTLTLTTTGTSGVSTLSGSTLNIPNYSGMQSLQVQSSVAQDMTGLTTFTFGSLPNTVRRIKMFFDDLTPSAESALLIQLGTSTGFGSSAYEAGSFLTLAPNVPTESRDPIVLITTTGILFGNTGTSMDLTGKIWGTIEFIRDTTMSWYATGTLNRINNSDQFISSNVFMKAVLPSDLTQIGITNLTTTFSSGTISLQTETQV